MGGGLVTGATTGVSMATISMVTAGAGGAASTTSASMGRRDFPLASQVFSNSLNFALYTENQREEM